MSTIANLMVKIDADLTGLKAGLASAEKLGGKIAKTVAVAGVAAATAATASIVAIGVKGLRSFSETEEKMKEVFTLLPGMTSTAMKEMSGDVQDFSREFGVLPNQTIPALYQAISAGVPKDNVFSFLEVAQKAARGGVASLETAVDGITSVINAYGTEVLSASQASDLMFTAVRLGKTTFGELSASLFQVIPTAASLGVGFGDITGALARMTAQGVPTSVATTQLRQMFVELSKAGSDASDMFLKLSGQTFKDFISSGGNVADVLEIMEQGAAKQNLSISDLFGSVEAGNAALSLSGKNLEGYRSAIDEMANSAGATEVAFETMNTGVGASMDRLKANIAVAMDNIGEKLAPTFEKFATWIEGNMPGIETFIVGTFETIAETLVRVSDFVISAIDWWNRWKEVIIPVGVALATVAAVLVGMWIPGALLAAKAAVTLQIATLGITWPIALLVLAFGGLVAAGVALYRNWEEVKEFGIRAWNSLVEVIERAINGIVTGINWLINQLNRIPGVNIPLVATVDFGSFRQAETMVKNYEKSLGVGRATTAGDSMASAVTTLPASQRALNSYATGTPYVPQTGLYKLHEGERVIPAHLNNSNSTMGNQTIIITLDSREIGRAVAPRMVDTIRVATAIR